jgi:hypothetical protein
MSATAFQLPTSLHRPSNGNTATSGVALHHGVVDAFGAAGLQGLGAGTHEFLVVAAPPSRAAAGQDVGGVLLHGGQQRVGAAQEDAGVPQHVAGEQQLLRLVGGGLFDEAADGMAAIGAGWPFSM